MTYKAAKKELPAEVNYDPLEHKSIEDFVYITKVELDLLKERQSIYGDMDSKKRNNIQRKLQNYIKKFETT